MDLIGVTRFLGWCVVLNGGLLVLWTAFLVLAPDMVYRLQNALLPLPRPTYDVIIYSFLAFFKIIYLVFNVVPYVALLIIT